MIQKEVESLYSLLCTNSISRFAYRKLRFRWRKTEHKQHVDFATKNPENQRFFWGFEKLGTVLALYISEIPYNNKIQFKNKRKGESIMSRESQIKTHTRRVPSHTQMTGRKPYDGSNL